MTRAASPTTIGPVKKHEPEWLELPRGPRPDDQIEVEIEDLTAKGQGRARFCAYVGPQKEPRTYRVEVRKAIPGDRLLATVERNRRGVINTRIAQILSQSPMRKAPRCRHFGCREEPGRGCGGCTLQNMTYEHQLRLKRDRISSLLAAHGLTSVDVDPPIAQPEPWYYRNKMELTFAPAADDALALGLFATGYRRTVLRLEECFLQSPESARLVRAVGEWARSEELIPYRPPTNTGFLRTLTIRESQRTGDRMVELTTSGDAHSLRRGQQTAAEDIAAAMAERILQLAEDVDAPISSMYWTRHRAVKGERTSLTHEHIAGSHVLREQLRLPGEKVLEFEVHPRAFFQTNTEQAEILYAMVLENAGLLEHGGFDEALDLYCGTGTIALCLAPYVRHVCGVELQPDAVDNARQNARLNATENTEFLCGDVADVLKTTGFGTTTPANLVVVDPPRSGLRSDARKILVGINASNLVYVSCNPETLAADLAELSKAGWRIDTVTPIDLFPQTYHIEIVVGLSRVAGSR